MGLDCSYMPVKPLNIIILLLSLAMRYATIKAREVPEIQSSLKNSW